MIERAQYGSWVSPLTAERVASASVRLGQVVVDGDDIYWLESRPVDGRTVIMCCPASGAIEEITPPGASVRTRVYEYGGAPFTVWRGTTYYVEWADQQLRRLQPGRSPAPITSGSNRFYADVTVSPAGDRLVCVCEDHGQAGGPSIASLVSLPLDGGTRAGDTLLAGDDFYAAPRFSPDGRTLAWVAWRHPNMPWDGTELWVAAVGGDGGLIDRRKVAGGARESVGEPRWSPDGDLFFVSDRTGWWNLYRVRDDRVEAVCPLAAEFGRPQWQLGTSTWSFAGRSRLVAACAQQGRWRLATIDLPSGALTWVPTTLEPGESVAATPSHAVIVGGSSLLSDALVRVDLETGAAGVIRSTSSAASLIGTVSVAEPISYPADDGESAYLFFYPPANHLWEAQAGELPPLLVNVHGGPTAAAHQRLNLEVQFWTSRGFAVADVNYSGSTGYGRKYRERLSGWWGVRDVSDCVDAARFLIARGRVDPERIAIRGRSAGGYTALAAMTSPAGVFRAAASYYGISDLERLTHETHAFESHYLDGLVGPYPERRDLYLSRSPIARVNQLSGPVIFFQGLDDRVVPPDQAQLMADALRARGLPVELMTFAGEGHGFRKAATIAACLEAELAFYRRTLGLSPQ
jgi:dipeptidyl aminopeptidase/acylaminoacyl peptidase